MNLKDTYIQNKIRSIPKWPIENVIFRDITTLLRDPEAFRYTCDKLCEHYKDMRVDKIIAIDARGFLFASVVAYQLNVGLVPVRKIGKLPPETMSESYSLEYGENVVEISEGAIVKGDRVVIIDDLIATGGSLKAAVNLVERQGGQVLDCSVVIELPDLKGREFLNGYNLFALAEFEGE